MTPTNTVMDAVFALVKGVAPFVNESRRFVLINDVTEFPVLFVRRLGTDWLPPPARGLPTRRHFDAEIVIYSDAGSSPDLSPEEVLNDLVDAVAAALLPLPGYENQTLNGLVSHCRIEGREDISAGDLGDKSIAILPLKILIP